MSGGTLNPGLPAQSICCCGLFTDLMWLLPAAHPGLIVALSGRGGVSSTQDQNPITHFVCIIVGNEMHHSRQLKLYHGEVLNTFTISCKHPYLDCELSHHPDGNSKPRK